MPRLKNVPYVVVRGDPVDGFSFSGPFTDKDAAGSWGELNSDGDWWIAPLAPPEEG